MSFTSAPHPSLSRLTGEQRALFSKLPAAIQGKILSLVDELEKLPYNQPKAELKIPGKEVKVFHNAKLIYAVEEAENEIHAKPHSKESYTMNVVISPLIDAIRRSVRQEEVDDAVHYLVGITFFPAARRAIVQTGQTSRITSAIVNSYGIVSEHARYLAISDLQFPHKEEIRKYYEDGMKVLRQGYIYFMEVDGIIYACTSAKPPMGEALRRPSTKQTTPSSLIPGDRWV